MTTSYSIEHPGSNDSIEGNQLLARQTPKIMGTPTAPIRVTVVQRALAKYRVPVFRELAGREGISLRIVYGCVPSVPNSEPEGFEAIPSARWEGEIAGNMLMFHGAEWTHSSRHESDVIVMTWVPRSITLLPSLLRARSAGVGTVLWGHGYSKNEKGWWRNVRNWIARQASALVFYEPRTREDFVRAGWNPDKLFVAINSLDHTEIDRSRLWWQEHPEELAQFRQEHGIDKGPMILFVSRLQPANRVDLLIRATVVLAAEIPGLKTAIIGNGSTEKERLRSLAVELGAAESVLFLEGIYDEIELAPWFLSADVFCYPANIGLSGIHSLWYGLPIVTSDNLAIQNPEIVALEPGINGLVYKHESVMSLVEALRRVLTDDNLRSSMVRVARSTVENKFTISNMVDGLELAIRYAYHSVHAGVSASPGAPAARE